jgi:hypothetical protein
MLTDEELHDAFATLDRAPSERQVRAVLERAAAPRRRRAPMTGLAATAAAAAVAVLVVALPRESDEREVPPTAAGLLQQAADAASRQPAFTGYRYADVITRRRSTLGGAGIPYMVTEQRRETWIDLDWKGEEIVHDGRIVEGRRGTALERNLRGWRRPFAFGDAPKAFVDRLPSEPAPLKLAIVDSMDTEDWREPTTDPVGKDNWIEYHVLRRAINLLELANTTPALRAGLWGVVAMAPGVEPAPEATDPLGRRGEAVRIPVPVPPTWRGEVTVIFDPAAGALLYWSEEGRDWYERHTVVRSAHVAEIGDRTGR